MAAYSAASAGWSGSWKQSVVRSIMCAFETVPELEAMSERIERDFSARDEDEQKAFLEQTWCDGCMEVNLGMGEPVEYELNDTVFIEGKCNRCGQSILTELTEDDF